MQRCRRYNKVKYKTEEKAHEGLMWIWSHANEDMRDLHVYKCEFCNMWHVGHKSKYEKRMNGQGHNSANGQRTA